jgi:hypothetical protein
MAFPQSLLVRASDAMRRAIAAGTQTSRTVLIALTLTVVSAACGAVPKRTPEGLLTAALDSLAQARSVHYREVQSLGPTTTTYESDATADAFHARATSTNGSWSETVLVHGRYYDRGSATGGSWRIMPEGARIAAEAGTIAGLASCLRAAHGHLSAVGSLSGSRIQLADAGDTPGAGPGRWFLSAGQDVRLDRYVHTGPDRAGGPANCGRASAGVTITSSLTKYSARVVIEAPRGAAPAT